MDEQLWKQMRAEQDRFLREYDQRHLAEYEEMLKDPTLQPIMRMWLESIVQRTHRLNRQKCANYN